MRGRVGVLAIRAGLVAGVAAEDEVVGRAIVGPAGGAREFVCIEAAAAVLVAEDAGVVGVEPVVPIRASHEAEGAVQVVVDDACHVAAVGAVSGVFLAGLAGVVALLAAVVQRLLVPPRRAVQSALS